MRAAFTLTKLEVEAGRRLQVATYGDHTAARFLLFDPGSYGIFADALHFCSTLAERGWFAASMTRAGLFGSDPLPPGINPSPDVHIADMQHVLTALGRDQRFVLAGHSMAGLRLHLAAHRFRDQLAGLVLIDAVCPSLLDGRVWPIWVASAKGLSASGRFVLPTPLGQFVRKLHPNTLKLEGRQRQDKIGSIACDSHLSQAVAEVRATDRRFWRQPVMPALHLPAFFATATPVSQGTGKLLRAYEQAGTWAERIKLRGDGHISVLAPPSAQLLADGAERLWRAAHGDRF